MTERTEDKKYERRGRESKRRQECIIKGRKKGFVNGR